MQFFPGSDRVDTAVWMHHLDANTMAGEEARRQLHKNVASNIKQVQAATPHKARTIRPPASHHENYPCLTNQLEHTYSSYMRIRDVAQKTCQRQWTIGKSGERGSRISVLMAWHDDDDDDISKSGVDRSRLSTEMYKVFVGIFLTFKAQILFQFIMMVNSHV